MRRHALNDILRLRYNEIHRLVPGRSLQHAILADQRVSETVFVAVGDPTVKTFGTQTPVVDAVDGAAADADDLAVFDAYVAAAAVAVLTVS
jgi:hypothetical protein